MKYPIYLRHTDGSVIYLIHGAREFEEWKRIGSRFMHSKMEEVDYATGLYIQDLLAAQESDALQSMTESEFTDWKSKLPN